MKRKNYNSFIKSIIRKFKGLLINAGNRVITFIYKPFSKPDNVSFLTNANFPQLYLDNASFKDEDFFFTILLSAIEFLRMTREKMAVDNFKKILDILKKPDEARVLLKQKLEDRHNYKWTLRLLSCFVCNWQDVQLSDN